MVNKTRLYCNICRNETVHEITVDHRQNYHDYFWGFSRLLQAQILKCCGCEYLSFRLFKHPYEFQEKEEIEEFVFPEREDRKRRREYFFFLPPRIENIYTQVNRAIDLDLNLLAGIGLRGLLEAIVVDRFAVSEYSYSVKSKIDALKKHFSSEVIDTLHEFRFLGNKAIHSLEEPYGLDVHRALNVIEGIMVFFYSVEDSANAFKELKGI